MSLKKLLASALVATIVVVPIAGCGNDVETIEPQSSTIAFEGTPDARFAGNWKTENGVSNYQLDADGSYKLQSKIKVQGKQPFQSNLNGKWAVKGDKILFKDQSGNVSSYQFSLEGAKLTLTTSGVRKSKTIMDRQP